MNSTQTTLRYYNDHAKQFIADTLQVDFTQLQEAFLATLPPHAHILDLGCGSGRDAKTFIEAGCRVTAVDGAPAICRLTEQYLKQPVICQTFQDYRPTDSFDGIWACASLLHLPYEDIITVMQTLSTALNCGGCFYASFKYGTASATRHERFFTDMTETRFAGVLAMLPSLRLKRQFITTDARPNRKDERWLNVFLIKSAP